MGLGLEQIVLYVRFIVVLRGSEGEGVILGEDVEHGSGVDRPVSKKHN